MSSEVFLASATVSGVVRCDRLSPASTWPVDWQTRPSLVRSYKAELQPVVQHASSRVVLLSVMAFEDFRQVGFGPMCTSEVGGSSLLPLGSSSPMVAQIWLEVAYISPVGNGYNVSLPEVMAKGFRFDGSASTFVLESSIPLAPKPLKFCNRMLNNSRFAKMDDSLIAEAVLLTSAPLGPLGFGLSLLSLLFGEIVAKTLPENIHGPVIASAVVPKTPPASGILRKGFLKPA
jgi:hypothetical protein